MSKKIIIWFLAVIFIVFILVSLDDKNKIETKKITLSILSNKENNIIALDSSNNLYKFNNISVKVGELVEIEYDVNNVSNIVNYKKIDYKDNVNGIPVSWLDNGIFSDYYLDAYNKLQELTLEEKIGQLLLVRYPDNNQIDLLKEYNFGGYIFFSKDFSGKNKDEVINEIKSLQENSKIPLITAVDEEGGTVVRVSSNPKLSNHIFLSPRELYKKGGMDLIISATKEKSTLLNSLGLNLNLAPVVDIAQNPNDYMYLRSLGEDTNITSMFASEVILASKDTGVSYALKHFPGYGNNSDTHLGMSIDSRSYEELLEKDLPPFIEGINIGCEAILVSHNIVTSIDDENPASISLKIHELLRNKLKFTGIIITDDIAMGAITNIDSSTKKAVLAKNNLIITTDYNKSFNEIKEAITSKEIKEEELDELVFKILSWKYYKGLIK